jgi:transposase
MAAYTFKQFQAQYPNDDACLEKILVAKFGGIKFVCPGCQVEANFHLMSKRKAYACQNCGHHVYPCAGTIFHKSPTPLTKWFFALYLMTSTRHGVAAKELEHQLRKLMAAADYSSPLSGHVEIDETIVGGHQKKAARKRKGSNKTTVMGMVERGGMLRAGPVPDQTIFTLEPIVLENVAPGSTLSTDELPSYSDLKNSGYAHGAVK